MVARRAHNPKVVGSNPAPATKFPKKKRLSPPGLRRFFFGNLVAGMEPYQVHQFAGCELAVRAQRAVSPSARPSSRNHAIRQALTQWLNTQEEQGGMTQPEVLRRHFHAAYISLRSGRDEVEIHRLRHLLGWPCDRFDAMVEQLRAESQVVLHVGDASGLSDEERRQSYEVNGQLYFRLSWQK